MPRSVILIQICSKLRLTNICGKTGRFLRPVFFYVVARKDEIQENKQASISRNFTIPLRLLRNFLVLKWEFMDGRTGIKK
ncbi:hypothetical protein J14TS2_22460 [Bacillus sp. J14TS2]|nr:hypothetical protein J14TS2_22460 [Bacillus sp. J14TS2]